MELVCRKHYRKLIRRPEVCIFHSPLVKDGAYFCYCAYVLGILRYSGFLWVAVVLTNTGIFLRGFKLCGETRT